MKTINKSTLLDRSAALVVTYGEGWYSQGHLRQARVNALPAHAFGRLQSASGEELHPFFGRTLMPSVLDRVFKEEL